MTSCLGIYLNEDIVKYAKMSIDSSKNFKVEQYGTRFIKNNKNEILNNIIDETDSKEIPIVVNPQSSEFIELQIFEQAQNKSYINEILKMEFEAWCEKKQVDPITYSYVYMISDYKNSDNKYNAVMNIIERKKIDSISNIFPDKTISMYPPQLMIHKLTPEKEENYILINLEDELSIVTVINNKVSDIKIYDIGMKQILSEIAQKLGSYQKAYEACKQINVFTEGRTINDSEIEAIIEPVLQEVLKYALVIVNKNRKIATKVYITGTGSMFTNIDILFTEFLDLKSDLLKPEFMSDSRNIKNVAETLETIQAISIACGYLKNDQKDLEYIKEKKISSMSLSDIFGFGKNKKVKNQINSDENKPKEIKENKYNNIISNFGIEQVSIYVTSAAIVAVIIFISYIIFSNIFDSSINNMMADISTKDSEISTKTSDISTDINYINTNTSEYKVINTEVQELVDQIETNQIGKISTYNVATFLQKIIKIIPKNVQLKTISSDDNKNVKISAQSTSYADLGYFVAQLKLEGVLKSVVVNSIQNGTSIVIEIGGELP